MFLSGILVHHYGSRCIAVIGAIVTSGGIIVSSFSYNLTMLCLTYGVIGGKYNTLMTWYFHFLQLCATAEWFEFFCQSIESLLNKQYMFEVCICWEI